jgi:histidinol-phosphate aminotransferase
VKDVIDVPDVTDPDLAHHGDRDAVPGLTDLAVNVRAGTPPQWLRDRIAQVDLARYPDQAAALEAVAARHRRPRDEVLLTAGAAEAFVLIAHALRAARAVVVHPQFTEPEAALRAAGHQVRRLELSAPFELDPLLVPEEADLVVIGNPTNPTSVLHRASVIRALRRPGRLIVVDEAFADTVPGEAESLAADRDLSGLIVVRSLTKTWGLAGLRVGYVLAQASVVQALKSVQPAWPVSAPALEACVATCSEQARAEASAWSLKLVAEREELVLALNALTGIRVPAPPRSSFVLIDVGRAGIRSALHKYGFAVRRGETFPGLNGHWIRVAVRDHDTNTRFVAALAACLTSNAEERQ